MRGRRRRGAEEGDVRAAWIGAAPVGRRRRRRRRRVGVYGGKTGGGPHESSFCGCRFAPGLSEYLSLLFRQAYSSRSVLFQQIRPSAPAQSSQIKLEQISRGPSKTKAANAAHSVAATTPNLAFRYARAWLNNLSHRVTIEVLDGLAQKKRVSESSPVEHFVLTRRRSLLAPGVRNLHHESFAFEKVPSET